MITKEEAKFLFKAARFALKGKKYSEEVPKILNETAGVFVTLHTHPEHKLRGCMGIVESTHALIKGVQEAAKTAAFDDYRYKPLTPEEFDEVVLEISILSKPMPCKVEEVEEGDGVILHQNKHEGLFLPQVWDHFPRKNEFLDQLCLKAGLGFDCWKESKLMKFKAIIFEEIKPDGDIRKN